MKSPKASSRLATYRGYKAGQQVGKGGLEKEYEDKLRGKEGIRFVEVDARGRVVREAGAREDLLPEGAPPLYTNIDLDLQRYMVSLFGDSLHGGAIAIDPVTGEVLALHSAPTFDPNRFIGGIPADYWRELNTDPRRPLYNKVIQGRYPPGSTWKLATATWAIENGIVTLDDVMPTPCTGGFQFGNRYFHDWEPHGHGSITLAKAIEVSCDVYFYQLGLKVGITRLVAGGVALGFRDRTGIDLPDESAPLFPYSEEYYNKRFGPRGWNTSVVLNLAIGQGENSQTVASMARFYTALATDGEAARPSIVRRTQPQRTRLFQLTDAQNVRAAPRAHRRGRGRRYRGRVARRGTRHRRQDRLRAEHRRPDQDPRVVRGLRAGRPPEDRRRRDARTRRPRRARRPPRVGDHGALPQGDAGVAAADDGLMRVERKAIPDFPLVGHRAGAVGLRHPDGLLGRPDRRADRRRAAVQVADHLARGVARRARSRSAAHRSGSSNGRRGPRIW